MSTDLGKKVDTAASRDRTVLVCVRGEKHGQWDCVRLSVEEVVDFAEWLLDEAIKADQPDGRPLDHLPPKRRNT